MDVISNRPQSGAVSSLASSVGRSLKRPSLVDHLAEKVGETLGCKVTVYRIEKRGFGYIPPSVDGYVLQFERGKFQLHTTPKLNVQAAKSLLATLCDLQTMGFIDGKKSTQPTP